MSYNGSGTFSLAAGNPVVTGTAISSTWANGTLSDIATGLTNVICKDGQSTPTANLPMGNFKLTGLAAGTAAGQSVRYEQSPAGILTTTGDIIYASAANTPARLAAGAAGLALLSGGAGVAPAWGTAPLRSYLAGLTLSTAGASATMSIAAGVAADSTNVSMMTLAAINKTTAAWVVGTGNGGLDTGAIANSTWYHFYVIQRVDTSVVDVLISLSATAPTLPTNYTLFRRIGSGKTNGSAQWVLFTQDGDYFRWSASVRDVSDSNPGTASVTKTLASVPTGVNVFAIFNASISDSTPAATAAYVRDLAAADEAPSAGSTAPLTNLRGIATGESVPTQMQIRTNTSAQIAYRLVASTANTGINFVTLGWIDQRGKNQ